ncbi:MAG: glycosyltransferase family 2 protein [Bacteroidetes bacterium]|nr:glycosyltransferase family 2 protein [Bacteroidota bacterium]
MIKISAVIITFNEEKNIERCLNSLSKVSDEIVVVDSYSTDGTKEICQQFGVKFIPHPFEGFIEQKNWAAAQASFSYVLSLDADEELSGELTKAILKVKNSPPKDGYYINRFTSLAGEWVKHSGWYPDRKLLLWNRTKGEFKGQNPHAGVRLNANSSTERLHGDLLHYSFSSLYEYFSVSQQYAENAAQAMIKNNKTINLFKILVNPFIKFIKNYFFNLGFTGGITGLIICFSTAYFTFLKYAIAYYYKSHSKKST